jgi:hypothetical protein
MNPSITLNFDKYLTNFKTFNTVQKLIDAYYTKYDDSYNEPNISLTLNDSISSTDDAQNYYKGLVKDRYPLVYDFLLSNFNTIDWIQAIYGSQAIYKLAGSIDSVNMISKVFPKDNDIILTSGSKVDRFKWISIVFTDKNWNPYKYTLTVSEVSASSYSLNMYNIAYKTIIALVNDLLYKDEKGSADVESISITYDIDITVDLGYRMDIISYWDWDYISNNKTVVIKTMDLDNPS